MSITIIFLAAVISAFMNKVNGIGAIVSRSYNMHGFHSLDTHNLDTIVYYTQGNKYEVEVFAQQNIVEVLELYVINGRLNVRFKKTKRVKQYSRIALFITAPELVAHGQTATRMMAHAV